MAAADRLRRALVFGCVALALAACRSAPEPGTTVRQIDRDGDGRTDAFVRAGPDGATLSTAGAPEPGSDPERTLVLAVDAIPWETIRDLQDAGGFRWLFPASRLISPFPSLTDVGFTVLLRSPPPAGYEDRFFDPVENALAGGLTPRISGEYRGFAPFHDVFDWEEPHLWGGAVFLVPDRISSMELVRFDSVLEERRDEAELVVYLGSTDGLGHMRGRDGLADQLARIDTLLQRWLAGGEADRRVVLFSDHAMTDTPSRMFDLEEALEREGFRSAARIETPRDVVAPRYGLVGSIAIYTACGREEEVARAVVRQEGADLAVWQSEDDRGALDRHGDRPVERRSEEAYPDGRRRALAALEMTENPASVVVSLEDGWHFGSELFDAVVDLEGTHGALGATSSEGFLASNVDRTPETIDAGDAWRWLGLERAPTEPEPARYRCVTPPASPPSRSAPR